MLIRRVLANLVENAVQAAEAAGREPAVRIASPKGTARPRSSSTTTARVWPADARERIFDPYMTTKEHGTGLGLAIVRKIMLDHGGDVRVAETPSPLGGARFVVTLPVVRAAGAPPSAPPRVTPGRRRASP